MKIFEQEILDRREREIENINKSINFKDGDYYLKPFNEVFSFEQGDNIIKSFNSFIEAYINEVIDDTILEKALGGVYADTPENKKLGRVGQKYGGSGEEEGSKPKEGEKKEGDTLSRMKKHGVDYDHLEKYHISEKYIDQLMPSFKNNPEATKRFTSNLEKLATAVGQKKDGYKEALNLKALKFYIEKQTSK